MLSSDTDNPIRKSDFGKEQAMPIKKVNDNLNPRSVTERLWWAISSAKICVTRQFKSDRITDECEDLPTALPVSATMRSILAERLTVWEKIGWAAEQGMVPDGPLRRLLANHQAELKEHRRLLAEDRHALQAGLRRLAALFPVPPAPEPKPAEPSRSRDFSPLGDLLAQRPKGRLN